MKILLLLLISQVFSKTATWDLQQDSTKESIERLDKAIDLSRNKLYDEALLELNKLKITDCYNPASYLFHKICCEHQLLLKKECIKDIELLLERESEIPERYSIVAKMILQDIKDLEEDSLDEISRLMTDVERRLSLNRSGKIVRDQEQSIIDKLDKLIKDIEDQANAKQQSDSESQQSNKESQQFLEESEIQGGQGSGDIDNKELDNTNSWGNIPPAERQKSLQRMTDRLPSHYREIIEGYFRKLAKEK